MKTILITLALVALAGCDVKPEVVLPSTPSGTSEIHDQRVGYCDGYLTLKGDYRTARTLGRAMNGADAIKYREEWKRLLKSTEETALYLGRDACLHFEKDVP